MELKIQHIDTKKNIIGIDGGNTIKWGGQLNVLVIDNTSMMNLAVDDYPKIKALENQTEGTNIMNICFPNTKITILEKMEQSSLCELVAYQKQQVFPNEELYCYRNQWYCNDTTIHDLDIQKGDVLSLIYEKNHRLFVKKDGICGWHQGNYEPVQ